jgi:hypothetical protein
MWKDATMHHPESFRLSSINYIDMSSTIEVATPYPINPARLIKAIHSGLVNFLAGVVE